MFSLSQIEIDVQGFVAIAYLNRPQKANALDKTLWFEIETLAKWVHTNPDIRVLVLAAKGAHFCSGIDFSLIQSISKEYSSYSHGYRQEWLCAQIASLQSAITSLEICSKPVIAAIQGSCIGGGIDLICACDFRYGTTTAEFCVKEIDLAIVADIGTIQRLPSIVGEGIARELAYTAKTINGKEAFRIHLLNEIFEDVDSMMHSVIQKAKTIAEKSPLAIRNTKKSFVFSRDHTIQEGLDHVAILNAGILFSVDAQEAMMAAMQKRKPKYSN